MIELEISLEAEDIVGFKTGREYPVVVNWGKDIVGTATLCPATRGKSGEEKQKLRVYLNMDLELAGTSSTRSGEEHKLQITQFSLCKTEPKV